MSKGDIWIVWKANSCVRSASQVHERSLSAKCRLFTMEQLEAQRSELCENITKLSYPLPWFHGICWQVSLDIRILNRKMSSILC